MLDSRIKRRNRKGARKGRKENSPPRSSAPTFASSVFKKSSQAPTLLGDSTAVVPGARTVHFTLNSNSTLMLETIWGAMLLVSL